MVPSELGLLERAVIAVRRLSRMLQKIGEPGKGIKVLKPGWGYTSVLVCVAMHLGQCAEVLLRLYETFGEYFPTPCAYVILRSMFEAKINARYISLDPETRAKRYIGFGAVLTKKRLDALCKHKNTRWREFVDLMLRVEQLSDSCQRTGIFSASHRVTSNIPTACRMVF